MANTYYDSQLTAAEIEAALEAIDGVIVQANNGKVLAINNGKIEARSVQWGGGAPVIEALSVITNGTYTAPSGVDGYSPVTVNVSGGGGEFDRSSVAYELSSNILITQGRVAERKSTSSGVYLKPYKPDGSGVLLVDWSESWEIGVAFKIPNTSTQSGLFGSNSSGSFAATPGCEFYSSTGKIGAAVGNNGSSWLGNVSPQVTIQANKWYFLKLSYNSSTKELKIEITDDFQTYVSDSTTLTNDPYYSSSYNLQFFSLGSGGGSVSTKIDLDNTYVKASGVMVYGAYRGEFMAN